jgi:SAM-dependent methyltransferase
VLRRRHLPIPPAQLRDLIGGLGPADFDNPTRAPIFPKLPPAAYEHVFDLGCGCGRVARQLIQQRPRPAVYLGVDLHRGMVEWCQRNLAVDGFRFEHHDVYNAGLNPASPNRILPLPADAGTFSLVVAVSVFTHMSEDRAEHYLREVGRILRPDGYLHSTWFLFDKADFPMMQTFQNALFINETDPSNAVIFDREWVRQLAREAGLTITCAWPPHVRGFHWHLVMRPTAANEPEAIIPADTAAPGRRPPPLMPPGAPTLGASDT